MKEYLIVVGDNVHEIPVVIENLKVRTFIDATGNRLILRESAVAPEYGIAIHPSGDALILSESAVATSKVSYIKLDHELRLSSSASIVGMIEVDAAEGVNMLMRTSGSISATRYRLLSEVDDMTLEEMDGYTLDELDYITFD